MNLIPEQAGNTPGYWCSWGVQNYSLGSGTTVDTRQFEGTLGFQLAMDNLNQTLLFEQPGWASNYYGPIRKDLYVVLDVGWDLPLGLNYPSQRWQFGSLVMDTQRFPVCQGDPVERLGQLNELARQAGWRGIGLWVSPQIVGDGQNGKTQPLNQTDLEHYWYEQAARCQAAGIGYWKTDIGFRSHEIAFRQLLTEQAAQAAPDLLVEHATMVGPLNDEPLQGEDYQAHGQGRYRGWNNGQILQHSLELLSFSDVIRTYDVTSYMSVATTLDRVTELLLADSKKSSGLGLINCEDEPYLGAVLGCAIGAMRHPLWKDTPYGYSSYDPYEVKNRLDEVVRAVRWQRLAPAFGIAEAVSLQLSPVTLKDSWLYQPGNTWAADYLGREIFQIAPAIVARGLELPQVEPAYNGGEVGYVVASRHPNGAVAVGVLPRTKSGQGIYTPATSVKLQLENTRSPIGLFGSFEQVTLELSSPIKDRRVWGQDLAGQTAVDLTNQVIHSQHTLILGKDLINQVGRAAASPNDLSGPGLVLKII